MFPWAVPSTKKTASAEGMHKKGCIADLLCTAEEEGLKRKAGPETRSPELYTRLQNMLPHNLLMVIIPLPQAKRQGRAMSKKPSLTRVDAVDGVHGADVKLGQRW
jgi:hypothetical protein